jgi:mannose-1-phosphate guanylyltransferase
MQQTDTTPGFQASPDPHFWGIIPAGGVGSRLWPLSRANAPKFLLDLTGSGQTLLQTTWQRLLPVVKQEQMLVVTGHAHHALVQEQLPELSDTNILTESEPKDSSAAVGLAAALIAKRDPDAIVGSFAADHVIQGSVLFQRAVHSAIQAAKGGSIVTIGIHPTHPATNFGYIKVGTPRTDIAQFDVFDVKAFVEKPAKSTARGYIERGDSLWNAGMFIARADALLEQMEQSEPDLVAALREIADAWDTPNAALVRERLWPTLPKIAIDYSVAEPAARAGKMVCVAAHFTWDDVGDFASVANLLTRGRNNDLAVLGDGAQVLAESSTGIVVSDKSRLITVVGMQNVVVVDTEDALLVTDTAHAQDVKNLVGRIRQIGDGQVL